MQIILPKCLALRTIANQARIGLTPSTPRGNDLQADCEGPKRPCKSETVAATVTTGRGFGLFFSENAEVLGACPMDELGLIPAHAPLRFSEDLWLRP